MADDLKRFMNAISAQESGGNPNVVNKDSGAHGQFQIMPANWGPWSREAGLGKNAPRTQANQNRVARYKMAQYYKQFGSWEAVAVAWYAGPGRAAAWKKDPGSKFFSRKQGKYPSINAYVGQAMRRMRESGGGGDNTQANLEKALRVVQGAAQVGQGLQAVTDASATANELLAAEPTGPPPPSTIDTMASADMRSAFGDQAHLADDDDLSVLQMLYQQADDNDPGEDESTVGPYNVARLMAEQRAAQPEFTKPDAPSPMLGTTAPNPELEF
jgi:hypothetical protein